jgi:hypothetical protein
VELKHQQFYLFLRRPIEGLIIHQQPFYFIWLDMSLNEMFN